MTCADDAAKPNREPVESAGSQFETWTNAREVGAGAQTRASSEIAAAARALVNLQFAAYLAIAFSAAHHMQSYSNPRQVPFSAATRLSNVGEGASAAREAEWLTFDIRGLDLTTSLCNESKSCGTVGMRAVVQGSAAVHVSSVGISSRSCTNINARRKCGMGEKEARTHPRAD